MVTEKRSLKQGKGGVGTGVQHTTMAGAEHAGRSTKQHESWSWVGYGAVWWWVHGAAPAAAARRAGTQ